MSTINSVDDSNFDTEVLQSTVPVLVEFGATWCGPCKRQLPILEKLATDNITLKVVKLDIDDAPEVTSKFSIKSVPTIMLFKSGVKVDSKVGLTTAASLAEMVAKNLI